MIGPQQPEFSVPCAEGVAELVNLGQLSNDEQELEDEELSLRCSHLETHFKVLLSSNKQWRFIIFLMCFEFFHSFNFLNTNPALLYPDPLHIQTSFVFIQGIEGKERMYGMRQRKSKDD
ncbi:MAG: hypothetical protein EZS28_007158 [Streblomastix strix]|uniref:Uncharacterized protein n=1 Tax=Streblomastix strix TaxID=222440 RepID=A0A5J4WQI3_9EUKA|nr:MAG: hypothetical protein EZS28_007158 [Streblomastix strix]